jgi:hypothetical protein
MKTLVLYRPNSEHGRLIEEFIRNFNDRSDSLHQIELINIDTRDGDATATLYGVMQYPAILVLQNDGSLQKSWEGSMLPLVDEVVAYMRV